MDAESALPELPESTSGRPPSRSKSFHPNRAYSLLVGTLARMPRLGIRHRDDYNGRENTG